MKRKLGLIILIIIPIIIVGCLGYESKREEKLHKKAILQNPNRESYEGLINIYREKGEMENLAETVEAAINQGYPPEENQIYLDILEYYGSINDGDKVAKLMGDSFSEINLPISIYKEFLLKDKLPDNMDLIEMKCGDINGDNKNELIVLMASPQEGINMNYYERVKLLVYNLEGNIIYQDGEEGGYLLYPKIGIVDLNYDGVRDLYYNVIYDSITNANTMAKVVSLKDDKVDLIYYRGIDQIDIEIEITGENSYRIYSENMNQFYDIVVEESEKSLNPKEEPIWWEVYEKLTKDENGRDIIQTNFELKGCGMIQVNYDYVDGQIRPVDFKIEDKK